MSFNPDQCVAVDVETTGLHPFHGDRMFSISLCDDREGDTWYHEFPVDPFTREVNYKARPEDRDAFAYIREVLRNKDYRLIFHHARFDIRMLKKAKLCNQQDLNGRFEDTLFAARVCNTLEVSYGLKHLAKKYAKMGNEDEKDLKAAVMKGRRKARALGWKIAEDSEADYWIPKALDPESTVCEKYCRLDTVRTMVLWMMYDELMAKGPQCVNLRATYNREMRLWHVVRAMEDRGVRIDRDRTKQELDAATAKVKHHEKEMLKLAGRPFKYGSNKDLIQLIYGQFGLEVKSRTDTGLPSTDWKALREHADHPFVREMLAYRASTKSISTFFQKYWDMMLPDPLNPKGYVLHPGFNQCGTLTGRFSCSDPNLQQVANSNTSARGTDPIQARAPFGPRPGYVWYLADYSAMELRMFADIADEPFMLQTIALGRDLHTECANKAWGGKGNYNALKAAATALELGHDAPTKDEVADVWAVFGWDRAKAQQGVHSPEAMTVADLWLAGFNYDIVKAEKSLGKSGSRGRAKCVMYTKIYGGGPDAVRDLLYCTKQEAKDFMAQYDATFPRIKEYMEQRSRQAAKDGYVLNRFGRRLNVDPHYAYRAVNYEVQGSGADLVKEGMLRSYDYLSNTGLDAHIVLQVHDELIFEIHPRHAYKWLIRGLKTIMEDTGGRFRVEMPVEFKRATSQWDQKELVEL